MEHALVDYYIKKVEMKAIYLHIQTYIYIYL